MCWRVGQCFTGIRLLLLMLLVVIMMMMMTSVSASPTERATDSGCRRLNRRQRRMDQRRLDGDDDVTNNNTMSSSAGVSEGGDAVQQRPKHRLIRGSKQAVTITKREYLKSDWCKTEPFQQIIQMDGCLRARILNRFCYGQCNSFYIPKSRPEMTGVSADNDDDEEELTGPAHFRSCAVCAPKKTDWTTVVLRCPRLLPPFRRRRVRVVRHCKCLAVRVRH